MKEYKTSDFRVGEKVKFAKERLGGWDTRRGITKDTIFTVTRVDTYVYTNIPNYDGKFEAGNGYDMFQAHIPKQLIKISKPIIMIEED